LEYKFSINFQNTRFKSHFLIGLFLINISCLFAQINILLLLKNQLIFILKKLFIMKKQLYTLALMLFVAISSFAQFTLTATVPATTLVCYAAGNFNGWAALATTPMTLISTDNTAGTKLFGLDLPLTFIGSGTFQIVAGTDWAFAQSDPQFVATTNTSDITQNVIVTSFKLLPSPIEVDVTVPAAVNQCYIVGGPWGWTLPTAAQEMTLITEDSSTKVFAFVIFDKTTTHSLSVKFLAGLDGALWTYQQTATENFIYNGTDTSCSFVCDAFNAYAAPAAVMTINADNYSVKTINRKIEVAGKYSNVTLFNLQGRMIQSTTNGKTFVSNDLTSGMYIIRVDNKSYKQIIN
jgi:hypothetical protein